MFNPASQNSRARHRRAVTAPVERIEVPEHPQHSWTQHELSVLLGLMARQVHTSRDEHHLPEKFNEKVDSLHGETHHDLAPGEIHAMVNQILQNRQAFARMLMRLKTKRLTRALKRSFERALNFTGDPSSFVVGSTKTISASASGSNAIPLGSGEITVDGEEATLDSWGVSAAIDASQIEPDETMDLQGWGALDSFEQSAIMNPGTRDSGPEAHDAVAEADGLEFGLDESGWGGADNGGAAAKTDSAELATDWGGLTGGGAPVSVDTETLDAGWGGMNDDGETAMMDGQVVEAAIEGWEAAGTKSNIYATNEGNKVKPSGVSFDSPNHREKSTAQSQMSLHAETKTVWGDASLPKSTEAEATCESVSQQLPKAPTKRKLPQTTNGAISTLILTISLNRRIPTRSLAGGVRDWRSLLIMEMSGVETRLPLGLWKKTRLPTLLLLGAVSRTTR